MLPKFFIDRPIFAAVISIVITLAGYVSARSLPIAQFPNVTPPTIQVDCNYPGASAKVVSETVAAPIEQRVNGVEGMLYMASQSTSDGSYTLTITFEAGTDLDLAQILVQNRLNLAVPELPEVVRATGVTTRKRSPEILLTVALSSPPEPGFPQGRYDQLYLSNYAVTRMREELQRLPGISDVTIFGQRDYSMRVWVNPDKLEARGLTTLDVVNALRGQNAQVSLGPLGPPRGSAARPTQLPLTVVGRLTDEDEFRNVVVKAAPDGTLVRVKDVADVELGAKSHDVANRFDNKQTVGLAVFLLSDANALETADLVKAKVAELARDFPEGVHYEIGYDTTPFMEESIVEVFITLGYSILLVALVVLLFLQTWRAALIPLAAVPVAVVGTFTAMVAVGFSMNTLTLFGLVLAVGIVVDDAIVVVEAVQHQLELGHAPREATLRAMREVSGPVVAVGVVLAAVFVPCAFFPGIVGLFFRQFAVTIAASTLISTFNSLTLSPALAAILLKPRGPRGGSPLPAVAYPVLGAVLGYLLVRAFAGSLLPAGTWVTAQLPADWAANLDLSSHRVIAFAGAAAGFLFGLTLRRVWTWLLLTLFHAFEWGFTRSGRGYTRAVGRVIRVPLLLMALYAGLLLTTGWVYQGLPTGPLKRGDVVVGTWDPVKEVEDFRPAVQLPTGFIPQQDKGYLMASVQLPDAASAERTQAVIQKVTSVALSVPGVKHCNAVAGNSFVLSAYGSNFGSMFIILDTYENRTTKDLYADQIAATLRKRVAAEVPEAQVNIFGAPAVPRLGRAGGFKLMVEDRTDAGPLLLQGQTENLIEKGNQQPGLVGLFTVYKTDSPQLYVKVDQAACSAQGVNVTDVYATMQATLGSQYVNDFNRFGRTWQVNVQAQQRFRRSPDDVRKLKVRNDRGQLVPVGAVAEVKEATGPLVLTRYNMYPAAAINGNAAVGTSSGESIAIMERLCKQELPDSMAFEWSELAFIEQRSKDTGAAVFLISLAVVFLVLAALYESWSLPLAVILVVPVCVTFSLAGVWLTNQDVSYFAAEALKALGVTDPAVLAWPGRVAATIGVSKQDVNVFTQVGFVVLIGLACKNAILIVEYAKRQREAGADRRTAVLEACKLRLRPILMTSIAFILGVTPLLFARGAGAEMRTALGIAVFSGMLGVTAFGVFLTPAFFVLIDRIASAAVFQNRWVRLASKVALYVIPAVWLGLGFWLLVRGVGTAVRLAKRPKNGSREG